MPLIGKKYWTGKTVVEAKGKNLIFISCDVNLWHKCVMKFKDAEFFVVAIHEQHG